MQADAGDKKRSRNCFSWKFAYYKSSVPDEASAGRGELYKLKLVIPLIFCYVPFFKSLTRKREIKRA